MKRSASKHRPRAIWKGHLKFSLVTIPVKLVTARASRGHVDLDWLHKDCNQRIQYHKVCPVHGPVGNNEIVSGYKYGKNKYVIIDEEEIDKFRARRQDMINVETFVDPEAVDPRYFTEHTYYVIPDGEPGARPYTVFQNALVDSERYGIAQVVLFRKTQLVLVRPVEDVLTLTSLSYEDQVRDVDVVSEQLPSIRTTGKEVQLARHLIEASADDDFSLASYSDPYAEEICEYVEAKVKGCQIEEGEAVDEDAPILDFTEALRKSLVRAREGTGRRTPVRSPRRVTRRRHVS
jgi:DNA end-binding protein Ku